jgi:3-hydroxyacyl-CoA dehydrogenase/3-hydroxy-2-methylbutyryl-CoA dehydrogenase
MDVEGSVAVITGGASGLGEATVRMIVAGGGRAVILDLPSSRGADLVSELGEAVCFIPTDVTDEAQVEDAFALIDARHERLDLCVNAAGAGPGHRVVRPKDGVLFPLDLYKRTVALNLIGAFDVLRHAARKMSANEPSDDSERGLIVNVASVAATEGQIGQAAYSASKGALIASTLPLARDLEAFGIRVMTISPGLMATPLVAAHAELAKTLEDVPLFPRRFGLPDEFAALVRHMMENRLLNAEPVRLDAGTRLTAR